jgi:hypothetical protein
MLAMLDTRTYYGWDGDFGGLPPSLRLVACYFAFHAVKRRLCVQDCCHVLLLYCQRSAIMLCRNCCVSVLAKSCQLLEPYAIALNEVLAVRMLLGLSNMCSYFQSVSRRFAVAVLQILMRCAMRWRVLVCSNERGSARTWSRALCDACTLLSMQQENSRLLQHAL